LYQPADLMRRVWRRWSLSRYCGLPAGSPTSLDNHLHHTDLHIISTSFRRRILIKWHFRSSRTHAGNGRWDCWMGGPAPTPEPASVRFCDPLSSVLLPFSRRCPAKRPGQHGGRNLWVAWLFSSSSAKPSLPYPPFFCCRGPGHGASATTVVVFHIGVCIESRCVADVLQTACIWRNPSRISSSRSSANPALLVALLPALSADADAHPWIVLGASCTMLLR
jgi:hypothetical protein